MSLIDPINEKELMQEAGKQLGPLLNNALVLLEAIILRLRDETKVTVTITFEKKEQ